VAEVRADSLCALPEVSGRSQRDMDAAERTKQLLAESPLVAFSVYTHIQAGVVRSLGNDVLTTLNVAIAPVESGGDSTLINRAYGQFWLWVLAAYEIVRTMSQVRGCFSEPTAGSILAFKQHIAVLRIPFAKQTYAFTKQEYAAKSKTPTRIGTDASISGFDVKTRDILFDVRGTKFSARKLVNDFDALIQSIKLEDVQHPHGWHPPKA
jgi:hypothetical protein